MQLWIPNGNKWQTEIDLQIAELRYSNQQLEEKIAEIKLQIALLDRVIEDFEHAIFFLKNSNVTVALFEFHRMKKDLEGSRKLRNKEGLSIPSLLKQMSRNDEIIKRLVEERIAVRTRIIPIKDRHGEKNKNK